MIYLHYSENILDLKTEKTIIKNKEEAIKQKPIIAIFTSLYNPFNFNYINHIMLQQKKQTSLFTHLLGSK